MRSVLRRLRRRKSNPFKNERNNGRGRLENENNLKKKKLSSFLLFSLPLRHKNKIVRSQLHHYNFQSTYNISDFLNFKQEFNNNKIFLKKRITVILVFIFI